jgi:hypothetical protein
MERGDRGQLFVLAGLALAVLVVGVALLLNSGAYGANLAAQNDDPGVEEPREFLREAEIGANRVMEHSNYNNFTTYGDLRRNFTVGVHNWSERAHHHKALSGSGVEISEVNVTNGSRVFQNEENRQMVNQSQTADWTPVTDAGGIRTFRINVSRDSLVQKSTLPADPTPSDFRSSNVFRINVTDATGRTRGIYIYQNATSEEVLLNVDQGSSMSGNCSAPVNQNGRTTIYLTGGQIRHSACQPLDFLTGPPAPFSLEFDNGDNIRAAYEFVTDVRHGDLPAQEYGTQVERERAIFNATVGIQYTTGDARIDGNRTATPDRLRILAEGDASFTIPVGDRVTYKVGGNFETINRTGSIKTYNGNNNARGIGPFGLSFDDDAAPDPKEIPFTGPGGTGQVQIVDETGDQDSMASDARTIDTTLGIGEWQNGGPSVFYPRPDGGSDEIVEINQLTGTVNQTQLVSDSEGVLAIAGIADVDGDGAEELVYLSDSSEVKFVDDDGSLVSTGRTIPTSTSSPPIGTPGEFDDDGFASIPFVDASNDVVLLNASDNTVTPLSVTPTAVQSPMATIDWDADKELEIIYIDDTASNNLQVIDDVRGTNTVSIVRDDTNSPVSPDIALGVR